MSDACLGDLLDILVAEQAALTGGHFAILDDLTPRKLLLFHQLQTANIRRSDLQKITGLLAQNERLLAAALKGIRAARDRIDMLGKVRNGLQVYDQTGQFTTPPMQRRDLCKKA